MGVEAKLVNLEDLKAAYDKLNILTYAPAVNIASNTDLNTLITSGVYAAGTRAIAGSLTNKPDALTENFRMIVSDVTRSTSSNRSVIQIILERPGNLIFTRTGSTVDTDSPLWTGWSEIAKAGFFPFMNADAKGSFSPEMYKAFRFNFTVFDKTKTYSLKRVLRNAKITPSADPTWYLQLTDNAGTNYTVLDGNGYATAVGYTEETGETIFDFPFSFTSNDTVVLAGTMHVDWALLTTSGDPTYSKTDLALRIDPVVFYISEVLSALDAQAEADAAEAADKKARELFLSQELANLGLNATGGKALTTSQQFGHTGSFVKGGQTIKAPDGYTLRRWFAFDSAGNFLNSDSLTTQAYDMPSSLTVNDVTYGNILFRFTFAQDPYSTSNVMDVNQMLGVTDPYWDIPSDIYGAVGVPFSIHFADILKLESLAGYHVYVLPNSSAMSEHANNYGNRLRFACDAAADYTFWLALYRGEVTISVKKVTVHITDAAVPTIKALFIGDSFTDSGFYLAQLKAMMGESLVLYGTRGFDGVLDAAGNAQTGLDEGRASWALSTYVGSASKGSVTNPFYNETTQTFDFSKYLTDNPSFADLTDVFILSGPNDYNAQSRVDTNYRANYKTITDSIKAAKPGVRVHCMIPVTLNGQASNGGTEFRFTMMTFGRAVMDMYGGRENEGYYVIPVHVNLDAQRDLGLTEAAATDRNPTVVQIASDPLHPCSYGYYSMADMIFAHIKAKC